VALANRYGNVGRTRDVTATLSRRLRNIKGARPLIVLAKSGLLFADWRDCFRLFIGGSEEPFRSFALNWLFREREDGRYLVRAEDVRPFVVDTWKARQAAKPLNEYGVTRTARDLIRTATSLGMLDGHGSSRTFTALAMGDTSLVFYAHMIADMEGWTARIVESPLWRLAYMTPADVHAVLLRLHQYKRLHYELAGSLLQISLPHRSALEFAEGLAA
jgi:hypothetical protein